MVNYRAVDPAELEFVPVASADELVDGQRLLLDVGELSLVVFRVAGRYFALADLCTHDDGPLGEGELSDGEIECPRHGGRFNLETGKAVALPAVVDIPSYPVRVEGGQLLVGLPRA